MEEKVLNSEGVVMALPIFIYLCLNFSWAFMLFFILAIFMV